MAERLTFESLFNVRAQIPGANLRRTHTASGAVSNQQNDDIGGRMNKWEMVIEAITYRVPIIQRQHIQRDESLRKGIECG